MAGQSGGLRTLIDEEQAYHEVSAYTLTHGDPRFIHQHVVDAWAAQRATATTKPIALFFALAGLYLHVERGLTGRAVQHAHMKLARRPEAWPLPELPGHRGPITALDVVAAPAGPARDELISAWAAAVWQAYATHRGEVERVLRRRGLL